jgi:thiosulfate/3-mercaptopyruvate sulfurtransferase
VRAQGYSGDRASDPQPAPAVLEGSGELVTYCTIGGRAATAWFVLTHLVGRDRVRVYDGSWAEWGRTPDALVEGPRLTT